VSKSVRGAVAFSRKPCVVATEIAIAMLASQVAYGQQPGVLGSVERVEITGSRIPQLNVEGVSPITTINAQDIKIDGLSKAEDILNNMPQVAATQGSTVSNGASGTANVNLRGLGVNRNLVLVNGRRLPAGTPQNGATSYAADLNQIPAPLISRVDLLTGGASAVYGSDAITGVVNFIMNDKFEGIQVDAGYSFYNHQQQNPLGIADAVRERGATNPSQFVVPGDVTSDGEVHNISLLMGKNFADGKGNATLYFGYKVEDPVLQGSRDFSACALNPGAGFGAGLGACGGSSTSFPGRFNSTALAITTGNARTIADAAGTIRPFVAATDQFNFAPYNYYRRPSEQYSFAAFAHLDVMPGLRTYGEFNFHDNHTTSQVAAGGLFFGDPIFTASSENPTISNSMRNYLGLGPIGSGTTADYIVGRRNIEGGGRQSDIRHTSYRWVLGVKGDLTPEWSYDLSAQTGKVIFSDTERNFFSKSRSIRAMDIVTDPGTGQPACASFVNGTDPLCRPYNIFQLGQVSAGALNYLQVPGIQKGTTQQQVQTWTFTGDLGGYGIRTPWAKNGVGVVLGAEHRKEALNLETDLELSSFDLSGEGGPFLGQSGKISVSEWFGEVRAPLIEGRPWADLLSVNGSYRRSNYAASFSTNTYGAGAEWAPVKEYRLRGSYQHAVRAANIIELFAPQGLNLQNLTDPCGADAQGAAGGTKATAAQCAQSGLNPALFGSNALDSPAGQYNFIQGGNPALSPEKADTYTAGLVFTPIRNLTGSVDWWSIKVDGAVGQAPAQTTLNQCVFSGQNCNLVQRDQFGTLWILPTGFVSAINQNLGGYHTTGVDLAVNYLLRMGSWGSLNLNAIGTYVNKWEFEPIKGLGKFDCVGFYGPQCGTPTPKWRHKVRGTWTTPWNVDIAATWRHIDKVTVEFESGNSILNGSGTLSPADPTDKTLGSRDYLDLAAVWTINKTFSLRGGVNNVFDKDPPIVSSVIADPAIFGNGNTFPQIYDTLGRLIFLNLTAKW
jgi:iron complex outermembrane recepter protein